MTLINSYEVTGSTEANVEFTSIPNTFTDLVVYASVRTPRSAVNDAMFFVVNGSVNSTSKRTYANVGASTPVDTGNTILVNGNTSTAGAFANIEIYIGDYAGDDGKPYIASTVAENNAQQALLSWMGGSYNTTAITSIKFYAEVATYFSVGCKFYLYGISAGSDGSTTVTAT